LTSSGDPQAPGARHPAPARTVVVQVAPVGFDGALQSPRSASTPLFRNLDQDRPSRINAE
jgi:hypothetical protein